MNNVVATGLKSGNIPYGLLRPQFFYFPFTVNFSSANYDCINQQTIFCTPLPKGFLAEFDSTGQPGIGFGGENAQNGFILQLQSDMIRYRAAPQVLGTAPIIDLRHLVFPFFLLKFFSFTHPIPFQINSSLHFTLFLLAVV